MKLTFIIATNKNILNMRLLDAKIMDILKKPFLVSLSSAYFSFKLQIVIPDIPNIYNKKNWNRISLINIWYITTNEHIGVDTGVNKFIMISIFFLSSLLWILKVSGKFFPFSNFTWTTYIGELKICIFLYKEMYLRNWWTLE